MFASIGQIAEPKQSRALSIAWGDFVTKPSSNVNKAVTNCRYTAAKPSSRAAIWGTLLC